MCEKNESAALGAELRAVRQVKKLSLGAVAEPAKISATYLQKLEAGLVKNPSPRVLQRLAEVLAVSYIKLMELAGYLIPETKKPKSSNQNSPILEAIKTADLTPEELRAVAAFINYLQDQRKDA
jgi:transcriptional regulator with XRE-family HTH domain